MSLNRPQSTDICAIPENAIIHRDSTGVCDFFLVPETHHVKFSDYSFTAKGYEITGWTNPAGPLEREGIDAEEIIFIFLKWDGCCHITLRDADPNMCGLHVCGAKNMERVLTWLRWTWVQAQERIPHYDADELLAENSIDKQKSSISPQNPQ